MKAGLQRAVCITLILPFLCFTAGCATSAKNISGAYVSPITYQSYSCDQIGQEVLRIAARVGELTGQVDDKAIKDAWAMAIGLVLFWPALFFLSGGNSEKQSELARMKGEYDTLQQVAIQKTCIRSLQSTAPQAAPTEMAQAVPATPAVVAPAVPVAMVVSAPQPASTLDLAIRSAQESGCKLTGDAQMIAKSKGVSKFEIQCRGYKKPMKIVCSNDDCQRDLLETWR